MSVLKNISSASPDYRRFIKELKTRVLSARVSAARNVNRDMILLYWDIGRAIVEKQKSLGWGESVVEMVSRDLQVEFPSMSGFSPRNLWDMKRFYETYAHSSPILRQAVAELTGRAKGNGVAVYRLQTELPGALKGKLPTAKQLSDAVRAVLPERSGK